MKWKGVSPIFILIFHCYLFCLVQGPSSSDDPKPHAQSGASTSGHSDHHGGDGKGTSSPGSPQPPKHTDSDKLKDPEMEELLSQMLDDTHYDYPKPFKGIVLPRKDGDKKPRTKNPFTLFARKPEGDHWNLKQFKSNSESIESIVLYTQLKLEYVEHMESEQAKAEQAAGHGDGKKKANAHEKEKPKHGHLYKELLELKKNMPKEGIELIFTIKEQALTSALLLEKGVKNSDKEEKEEWEKPVYLMDRNDEPDPDVDDDDDDDDDDDEDPDETSTFTVMIAIMNGEEGFGDDKKCYLDLSGLSEYKPKKEGEDDDDKKPGFINRQRKKLINIAKKFFKDIWHYRKKKKVERLLKEANEQAEAAKATAKKPTGKDVPIVGDTTEDDEDDEEDNPEEDPKKNFLGSIKSKALKKLSEFKLIKLAKQGWQYIRKLGGKLDPQDEAEMEAEFGEADPLLGNDKTEPGKSKFSATCSYLRSWLWRTAEEKRKHEAGLLSYGRTLEDVKALGKKVADELKQGARAKGAGAPGGPDNGAANLKQLKQMKIHPWKLFKGVHLNIEARPGRYKKFSDDEFELVKNRVGLPNKFEDVIKRLTKEDEERKKKTDAEVMQEKMDAMSEKVGKILGDLDHDDKKAKEKAKKEIELCNQLGRMIEIVFYELDESDEPAEDVKGRIGGVIIHAIINKKDLNGLGTGLGLSLLGTSIIALLLDAWLWPIVIAHVGPFLGPYTAPFAILLYSWTPQIAETFDSMVIKRVIARTRGAKRFIPKKGKRMAVFQDALRAGSVAAVGSVFNNGMEYAGDGIAMLAPMIVANIVATSTSASMVPFEVDNSFVATFDNTIKKFKNGFFTRPDLIDFLRERQEKINKKWWNRAKNFMSGNRVKRAARIPNKTPEEIIAHWDDPNEVTWRQKKAILIEYIQYKVDRIMDFSKTSGMNRNSLSFGIMISTGVGFLMPYFLNYFGVIAIPASVIRIFLIILNAPTEILSMGLDKWASAKWGWDAKKYRRMVKLVVDKAIDKLVGWKEKIMKLRVRAKRETGPVKLEKIGKISDEDIYNVHYSNLFLRGANKFGKGVVSAMKATFKVAFPLFSMLGKLFVMLGKGVVKVVAQLAKLPFLKNKESFISKAMKAAKLVFTGMLEGPVVPNYLPDMVYVIQHPRTSTAPSLSPMSLKLETWLKLRGVKFYRMSHGIFLTALFTEQLPYVELNGKKLRGTTDDIIRELEKHFFLQEEEGEQYHASLDLRSKEKIQKEERHIRRHFDEVVHKIYMHVFMNASLVYDTRTVTSVVKAGTIRKKFKNSFLTTDFAVERQMIPVLPKFFPKLFYEEFGMWPVRTRMPIPHQKEFWDDFYIEGFNNGRILRNNQHIPNENKTYLEIFLDMVTDKRTNDRSKWYAYIVNLKKNKVPLIHGKMMRRIRRKVLDVLRKQKYRVYDAKEDIWKLKTIPKVSIWQKTKNLTKNLFTRESKTPQSPAAAGHSASKSAHKGTSDDQTGTRKQGGPAKANDHPPPEGTGSKPTRRKRQTGDENAPGQSDGDQHGHTHSTGDHKEEEKNEKKQKTKPVYFKDVESTLDLSYTKMILEAMGMAARRLEKTEQELSVARKGKKQAYSEHDVHQDHDSDKLYLFGDKPTPADASVFAQLALFIEIRKHLAESNKELHDYFQKIEQNDDKDHILWKYFQQIKKEWGTAEVKNAAGTVVGNESAWDHVKKTWTLNYEKMWDVDEDKLGDKYQGPYGFVYKGPLVDEGEWASRDSQDDDDQEGAEEEEEERQDHQEIIDDINKKADGHGAEAEHGEASESSKADAKQKGHAEGSQAGKKAGDAKKDPKEKPKKGQEENYLGPEFTWEELHKFLPMTRREAWKKLVSNGILFEKEDDEGNFLYNYPRIYAYISQKLFKMVKHDLMVEKSDSKEKLIQPDLPFDYGLEGTEEKLIGYINIMKGELNKFDSIMAGRLARVLVHVMAAKECEGEFTVHEAENICKDQYEEDMLGLRNDQLHWSVTVRLCLMEVEKKSPHRGDLFFALGGEKVACRVVHHAIAFGQLSKIYKNNAKDVGGKKAVPVFVKTVDYFDQTHTALTERMNRLHNNVEELVNDVRLNFNKLINPEYEMEDLDRFKPIEEDKLIHIDSMNHYSANEITLFYYPDIFAYIVLELLKLANDSRNIKPLKLMKLQRGLKDDIFYGLKDVETKITVEMRGLAQHIDEDPATHAAKGKHTGKERVVKAMFHFVAAFLCEIGNEGDKCGKHHRGLAEEKLKSKGKVPSSAHDLNRLVKKLVHKIITNFNEDVAEEELNKFGTKIAAEIETLPKGPGFFSMITSKITSIFTPSKQMPAIEKEMNKWKPAVAQEGGETGTVAGLRKANSWLKDIWGKVRGKTTADSDVTSEDDAAHGDVDGEVPGMTPSSSGTEGAGVSPSS